jgi:hypothetical protein
MTLVSPAQPRKSPLLENEPTAPSTVVHPGAPLFRLRAARHEIKRQTIMCRDSENLAYSPGSLLVVDGQLMRCKVSGVWIDTDEWGKPLPRTHGPSTGRGSSQ